MKNQNTSLLIEFLLLFFLLPVLLATPLYIWLKVGLVSVAFIYVLLKLRKTNAINFKMPRNLDWKSFWKRVLFTFILVVIATTLYVWFTDKDLLFYVPMNHPLLFGVMLIVYTLFSVWPQEVIYRTFFFERYETLFHNKKLFIFVNAIVFSLAHLFFRNTLVLILTFIGGLIFGYTYLKYRSTTLVSIEHALYGNWLFTVGMGQMLAFPGIEAS